MKKHYYWYLIIGIIILLVPTIVYLCFLIPKMSEAYRTLFASGGIIASGGFYGTSMIPEKWKYSGLFKMAGNSFTALVSIIIVQQFIMQIVGLIATVIVSLIIFKILLEAWRNGRRKQQNAELATEVARSVAEVSK